MISRVALLGVEVLTWLLLLPFSVFIPISEAGLKERVFETHLSNGLKVLVLENHKAPVATFQVWYRVGSRDEGWGKTGLSHVLEHMMFKGTEKVPAEMFSRTVEENGATYNAFTSEDFTAYFETLNADRVEVAIGLEADRMRNLILREEDFRTERMVVMEERRLRTEDNPQAYLMEQVEAAAFQDQPYHWPTIGWADDIARITIGDLRRYYRKYYQPANAFLVIVGDFNREDLIHSIQEAFGAIPQGIQPQRYRYQDPPQTGERRVFTKKEAQLPFLIMAYHVPNLREPDSYVLEVIATILSGGKSSRLYERLVQKEQVALTADAEHSLLSLDPSLFYISAGPLPGKDAGEVERLLDQELDRLRSEPVGEAELGKAKNQLEASFVFGQDSLFFQAMLLARHEIALDWRAIDDYIPSVRRVSPGDIQRVASRYLVETNRTLGVLYPLPMKEATSRPAASPIKDKLIRDTGEAR